MAFLLIACIAVRGKLRHEVKQDRSDERVLHVLVDSPICLATTRACQRTWPHFLHPLGPHRRQTPFSFQIYRRVFLRNPSFDSSSLIFLRTWLKQVRCMAKPNSWENASMSAFSPSVPNTRTCFCFTTLPNNR